MRRWLTSLTVAALTATAVGFSPPAAHAQESGPGLRLVYGDDPGSTLRDWDSPRPEHGGARNIGPVMFTLLNTGTETLHLDDVTFDGTPLDDPCQGERDIPVEGYLSCWMFLPAPSGAPGTVREFSMRASATGTRATVTDQVTGRWRFYDVVPQADVHVEAEVTDVPEPGTPVRFRVEKWPVQNREAPPRIVSLVSSSYGDLLDPDNRAVRDNTCPGTGFYQVCEFTAPVGTAPGTVRETVTLEVTDGTGPNGFSSSSVDVTVRAPVARTAAQWADAITWPRVRVGRVDATRATTPAAAYPLSRRCRSVVPSTLDALLRTPAPRTGGCRQEWNLTREATAAIFNEAVLADAYPAADTTSLYWQTFRALAGSTRTQERLARTYQTWNQG